MNVLLTHPSTELYGSDRMVLIAVQALVKRGHDVTVVLPGEGALTTKMRESGATVVVADIPVLRKSDLTPGRILQLLFAVVRSQLRIARILAEANPDIVYVNTIVQPWWIFGGKFQRRRVVVHVREAETQVRSAMRKSINAPLLLADAIICNSASTRREVLDVPLMSRKQISVIYNGKDWSKYRLLPKVGVDDPRTGDRLTVVGRLNPRKGQDIAIRALAEIVAAGHDATLTFVGDLFPGYEWYEDELRTTAARLDIAERIEFTGFQEDIRVALGRTDLAIVPSRVEPFGTVAAECMAAGLLTIVADVQGLAEIVENERNGLTVTPDDPSALARSCVWALTHPAEARDIAKRGQRDVEERFSLDRYERGVIDVLEHLGEDRD